jgi:hypothetical protein
VSRLLVRAFAGWRTGLSGPVIVLQAGTAVNYFGYGLIVPFEIIYLHQARGFPTATAGYLFVLSGDAIDRKLYDHVNSYTGENGSDGVVRLAAANLNTGHVVLHQPEVPSGARPGPGHWDTLEVAFTARAAFRIVPDASHSGERRGIMRSVTTGGEHLVVNLIADCVRVTDPAGYTELAERFARDNQHHQREANRLEVEQCMCPGCRIVFTFTTPRRW